MLWLNSQHATALDRSAHSSAVAQMRDRPLLFSRSPDLRCTYASCVSWITCQAVKQQQFDSGAGLRRAHETLMHKSLRAGAHKHARTSWDSAGADKDQVQGHVGRCKHPSTCPSAHTTKYLNDQDHGFMPHLQRKLPVQALVVVAERVGWLAIRPLLVTEPVQDAGQLAREVPAGERQVLGRLMALVVGQSKRQRFRLQRAV